MAQSECYFFFAPVSRIIRTYDRTKENKYERIRIAIVHAKFAFAENRHYFAHLRNGAYSDAHFARHYCAHNGIDFMMRNTRFNVGDFVVSLLRVW